MMGKITCGECKKSCKGQAVRLSDRYFHVKCFKCRDCGKQLAAGGFYSKDDKYYCADDYQRLFGTKCAECEKYVEGEVVTALGNTYHPTCFHCTKCNNKFAAGDKVTFTGSEYMCVECLAAYEKAIEAAAKTPPTAKKEPVEEPVVTPTKNAQTETAPPLTTSTPANKPPQRAVVDAQVNNGDVGGESVVYYNGNISPISHKLQESTYTRQLQTSNGDVSESELHYLGPHDSQCVVRAVYENEDDVFLPTRDLACDEKEGISPSQPYMAYSGVSPSSTLSRGSRKSPESTGSYEPKYDVDYGRFFKQSYLQANQRPYQRGPSINPGESKPKSPGPGPQHFHRPENFSYTQVRRDYIKPMKKESMRDGGPRRKSTEQLDQADDDNPSQPAAPHPDPRVQRKIDELAKMDSGVGKVFMKDLQRRRDKSPPLDPVSASRTPSASKEPPYKTRYESPVFASPSRDLDLRPRLDSVGDELEEVKYRSHTLPGRGYPAPRPGYTLTTPKSATLPASTRSPSYDPYESFKNEDKENGRGDTLDGPRSHHSSRASLDEAEYDPETGLRRSKWRSSYAGTNVSSSTYLTYRRSMPSMLKPEGPPQLYPYDMLLVNNMQLPPGCEKNSLEMHLSKDEFESIFHMNREEFYRMAEWKRNDLKKRVGLY